MNFDTCSFSFGWGGSCELFYLSDIIFVGDRYPRYLVELRPSCETLSQCDRIILYKLEYENLGANLLYITCVLGIC